MLLGSYRKVFGWWYFISPAQWLITCIWENNYILSYHYINLYYKFSSWYIWWGRKCDERIKNSERTTSSSMTIPLLKTPFLVLFLPFTESLISNPKSNPKQNSTIRLCLALHNPSVRSEAFLKFWLAGKKHGMTDMPSLLKCYRTRELLSVCVSTGRATKKIKKWLTGHKYHI